MNKLRYGTNVIDIADAAYRFRYQNGDEVLRFTAVNTTFDVLVQLENYQGTIEMLTADGELLSTYNVNLKDASINYQTGNTYGVELMFASVLEDKIASLEAALDELYTNVIPALMEGM